MGMVYSMPMADVTGTTSGGEVNWLLIGVILGSVVLGIVIGILLGRRAMKKRDI